MKTIAYMRAELYVMEDDVKRHSGVMFDCAGTGEQYIILLANMIRVSAEKIGLRPELFAQLVAGAIENLDEVDVTRTMVDRDAIRKARGEA